MLEEDQYQEKGSTPRRSFNYLKDSTAARAWRDMMESILNGKLIEFEFSWTWDSEFGGALRFKRLPYGLQEERALAFIAKTTVHWKQRPCILTFLILQSRPSSKSCGIRLISHSTTFLDPVPARMMCHLHVRSTSMLLVEHWLAYFSYELALPSATKRIGIQDHLRGRATPCP